MARTYEETRSVFIEVKERRATANVDALREAVKGKEWSVARTAEYIGGGAKHENRNLALDLLRAKGNTEPTKRQIASQMKSVQRWRANESGSAAQKRALSPASRALINAVGRNKDLAKNGFSIKLQGQIAVNGYKRDRKAAVDLEGDRALSFLENPNYADLGMAYLKGEDSLYGFDDDLQVDLISE